MALSGTLEDLSFAEIVQVINQGRKTGELIIRRRQEDARVLFFQGEVAQGTLGGSHHCTEINGAEVIYRLLGWREGEFEFHRSTGWVRRTIQESTDELILEGMKRLDEWEKVEEEMANMNVVLRLRAGKVGDSFDSLPEETRSIIRLIDARRTVADIIRESGLEPAHALLAITELAGLDLVEKWESPLPVSTPLPATPSAGEGERAGDSENPDALAAYLLSRDLGLKQRT
jgi:hypothetical protein